MFIKKWFGLDHQIPNPLRVLRDFFHLYRRFLLWSSLFLLFGGVGIFWFASKLDELWNIRTRLNGLQLQIYRSELSIKEGFDFLEKGNAFQKTSDLFLADLGDLKRRMDEVASIKDFLTTSEDKALLIHVEASLTRLIDRLQSYAVNHDLQAVHSEINKTMETLKSLDQALEDKRARVRYQEKDLLKLYRIYIFLGYLLTILFAFLFFVWGIKRQERSLRELSVLNQFITRTTTEGVVSIDAAGKILWLNPAAQRIFGYWELPGKGLAIKTLLPALDGSKDCTHPPLKMKEIQGISKSGEILTFEMYWQPNPTRAEGGFLLLLRDVSEQKRYEIQLKEERDRARGYLDVAGVMITVLGKRGEILLINKRGAELMGCQEEDMVGQIWADHYLPKDEKSRVEGVFESLLSGDIETYRYNENHAVTKHGEKRLFAWFNTVLRGSKGDVLGILSSGEDITERRQYESDLQLFKLAIDSLSDCVLWVNREGAISFVNRATCQALKFSMEELVGMRFVQVDDSLTDENWQETWVALKDQRGGVTVESRFKQKGGKSFAVETLLQYMNYRGIEYCLVFARDITQRKIVESEIRRVKDAAVSANKAKSEFLANISHEIRTPLAAVIGYADLMAESNIRADLMGTSIDAIRRNGRLLLRLVDDLLDLSKIEARQLKLEKRPVEILELVDDVILALKVKADEKGIRLGYELDGKVPSKIVTDPTRVRQILINLVSNSIKFTDVGEVFLKVDCKSTDSYPHLEFEIRDTGWGIPDKLQKQIFEPFFQVNPSLRRRHGGSGLGLALSRRLARALGGEVSIKWSRMNEGSCFVFVAPLQTLGTSSETFSQDSKSFENPYAFRHTNALNGKKILLAEDGMDNQMIISNFLKMAAAEVVVVDDGSKAVEKWKESPQFDLILMDIQMPLLDGYAATRMLRGLGCDIPIVALTAYAMQDDRSRSYMAGCDEFLQKPIEGGALIQTIINCLTRGRQTGQRPASVTPPSNRPVSVVNVEALRQDSALRGLVDNFVALLPKRVEELETVFGEGNWEEVNRLAHRLKGATSCYGFSNLAEVAAQIELETKDAPDAPRDTGRIKVCFEELRRMAVGESSAG